jgi:3D (Asp-Asp-Asp) domain-containing protein
MTRSCGLILLGLVASGCASAPPVAPPPPAPAPVRREPLPVPPAPPPTVTVVERPAPVEPAPARPMEVARRIEMRSTGYCLRGSMRTGVRTRNGMAATDPTVIPLGSVIRVSHPDGRLIGLFVAMDTGGAIRGNKIDLYMESCREALDWGIRPVVAEVIQIGWSR